MEIRTIGIDLGKTVFHLVGVTARGEVVVRKKCSRLQLLPNRMIRGERCGLLLVLPGSPPKRMYGIASEK